MPVGSSLEDQFVAELLSDLEKDKLILPTLPEVALKVRDTLEDENVSLTNVCKVIITDTALSARLVQVANSPLLRTSRQIESVDQAVMRMGSNMVRNLVTSIAMEQMFQATSDATDTRLRALWEHATEVAAISQALATQFTRLQPDQALLAGLIHDIGALPILTHAEDYPEILENEPLLDSIITNTHSKIGAAILSKWNFPAELVAVTAEHENMQYQSANGPDYVDIVIVANLQAHINTDHPLTKLDWNTVPSFGKLGLSPDVNVMEMDETSEAITAVKSALTI